MAAKVKDKSTTSSTSSPNAQPFKMDARQVRLASGMSLVVFGVFICLSIVSYYTSWSSDQDKFFSSTSLFKYLFSGDQTAPVFNVGGRLGATLAHFLVYKGAGIASFILGLFLAALGLHVLYGNKASIAFRYLRWASVLLLVAAPTLTYLFPDTQYPLGGALGNVTINYMNGLMGTVGTGMLLFAVVAFVVFVIFAIDLRPLLGRLGAAIRSMGSRLSEVPQFNKPTNDVEAVAASAATATSAAVEVPAEAAPALFVSPGNRLKDQAGADELVVEGADDEPPWEPMLIERADQHQATGGIEYYGTDKWDDNGEEESANANDDEDEDDWKQEPVAAIKNVAKSTQKEEPEFTFEVKQQTEKPAVRHGAHISIGSNEPYAPELDLQDYKFPTLDLLENRDTAAIAMDTAELAQNKDQIVQTLGSFGITIDRIAATVGPTVTLYEIVPSKGIKISKIRNLEDDIALNLAALGIRIIAPIPGKGTIGIEVPNANKQLVGMQTLLSSDEFVNNKMSLPIALGKRIDNKNYIVDLATMPHLLMAGATGQGKSVGINAILVSLLYKKHPSQLKFVMIDPKKVELSIYRVIEKHFLAKLPNEEEPIITDIKKVIYTLKALCDEMDDRYGLLKDAGARNIKEYNEKFIARRLNPENGHKYLPFIVLVIDEFADLIMTAGKEVELPIARLAQLSRAVGIHLIIATQRPSVNVITGTIKANFPARIAFKVSAKVDSRTILDTGGAEQLVGRGDMLISHGSELLRLQCAFVDTPEVEAIVNFIGAQRGYPQAHALPEPEMDDDDSGSKNVDLKNRDKLFDECARTVVQMQSGSTSNLQRRYNLGYNRAGRIMDQLEAANIVGPAIGSKPREVYIKTESDLEEHLEALNGRL